MYAHTYKLYRGHTIITSAAWHHIQTVEITRLLLRYTHTDIKEIVVLMKYTHCSKCIRSEKQFYGIVRYDRLLPLLLPYCHHYEC